MNAHGVTAAAGPAGATQAEEDKEERSPKISCLRALTFVQFWLGSVLIILGIAMSVAYAIPYVALLLDGIITVVSSSMGALAIYFAGNNRAWFARMLFSYFQLIYGLPLTCFYIWGATLHLGFVAFILLEAIQMGLVLFVILIYNDRYYPTCCFDLPQQPPDTTTHPGQHGQAATGGLGTTNIGFSNPLAEPQYAPHSHAAPYERPPAYAPPVYETPNPAKDGGHGHVPQSGYEHLASLSAEPQYQTFQNETE